MNTGLHKPSKTAIVSYILFGIAGGMMLFSISMLARVDVLDNWRLVLPAGEIHAGDTVVVQSLYEKKLDVTGKATRYIECKTKNGLYVRYPVSTATANRPSGVAGTGIVFTAPEVIPDLPTTCKFTITIDYEVLAFRHVIESQSSAEFQLLPKREDAPAILSQEGESQGTNQTASSASRPDSVSSSVQSLGSSSSTNSTPTASSAQRDMLQDEPAPPDNTPVEPTPEPSPAPSRPSIIDSIRNTITNLF